MASNPNLRHGKLPSRPTSAPITTPNLSLAQLSARWLAERTASSADSASSIRTVLPRHLHVEPTDLETYLNDDPLVGSRGAAIILGVSFDALKKWRSRGKGAEYYQYEEGGPVLYSVRALNAFKAAHLVRPQKKDRK